MAEYEVRDVVCDYGVYEDGELKLILNSRRIALQIVELLKEDERIHRELNPIKDYPPYLDRPKHSRTPRTDRYCPNCPYYNVLYKDDGTCSEMLMDYTLDLIKRKNAEIERLHKKVEELSEVLSDSIRIRYKEAKSEAVKEFAERLKRECLVDRGYNILQEGEIDNLVKEMTE